MKIMQLLNVLMLMVRARSLFSSVFSGLGKPYEALVPSYYRLRPITRPVNKVNKVISHILSNQLCTVSTYSYYVFKSLKEVRNYGDMLEWLAGSAQPADAQFARAGTSPSLYD